MGRWSSSFRWRVIGHWSLVILLLTGCSPPAADVVPTFVPPPTYGPPSGSTYTVEIGSIVETIETRGRVVAKQEALLVFPLGGALKAIHLSPGDQVEEDALLAELNAPEAEKEALKAQFDLELAETQLQMAELQLALADIPDTAPEVTLAKVALEQAEAELEQAEIEYDDAVQRPWEPIEVTEAYSWTLRLREWNYQAARARLDLAQQSLNENRAILELGVELARIRVERARALSAMASQQLSSTWLLAPFSGIIISTEKRPGDWVGAYEAIGAIADPSELWVVATVLEGDVDRITVGQSVTVWLDAYLDAEYSGAVLQVASQAVIWQGKSAYEVTVAFDDGQDVPATIRMGADVAIAGRSRENVLLVPAQAIVAIGGQEYVEVVGDDGNAERVEVQTGVSNGTETEIVSGLQVGQVIRIP